MHFRGSTPVERRAEIWNRLAGILIDYHDRIDVVYYERLVEHPRETVADLVGRFGREPPSGDPCGVRCGNHASRFGNLEEIRDALERFAPNRRFFDYD